MLNLLVLLVISGSIRILQAEKIVSAELVCTDRELQLHVLLDEQLRRPARAFVKERSNDLACSHVYRPLDDHNALMFRVPLSSCGMIRTQHETNRFSYSVTVIISFHRMFVSVMDHSYRLSCDYVKTAPAVEKDVTVGVGVRTPEETSMTDDGSTVVNCSYALQDINNQPLQMVNIGEQVRHSWQCPGLHPDQFIFVHSCVVNPEFPTPEDPVIVDRNGCTTDPMAMGAIEYSSDGRSASASHLAYKFPDYPNLLFKCAISICRRSLFSSCMKQDGSPVTIPPKCSSKSNSRMERSIEINSTIATDDHNVTAGAEHQAVQLSEMIIVADHSRPIDLKTRTVDIQNRICISIPLFVLLLAISILLLFTVVLLTLIVQHRLRHGR